MKKIKLDDKEFTLFIPSDVIQQKIEKIALQMNKDMGGKQNVLFISILNGSFMFTADLLRKIHFNCKVSFLKLSSYESTYSSGKVKRLIGLNEEVKGQVVAIIEDIIDTGITIGDVINQLWEYQPAEIRIATLLFKPEAYKKDFRVDYIGFKVPDRFVVGYGLDYKGLGRNLRDIYILD